MSPRLGLVCGRYGAPGRAVKAMRGPDESKLRTRFRREALGCFEKARSVQEKVLGHDREATGASYQNIGAMNYKLGKIPEAFQSFQEAFAIFEKVLGKGHQTTGRTYDDIEHLCSNDKYQPACDFAQDHPRGAP
jgi:tetratricopeptide (TPR) repeat protein